MQDWNKDGKYDMQDAFLEYRIYKSVMEDESEHSDSPVNYNSALTGLGIVLLIFGILIILL